MASNQDNISYMFKPDEKTNQPQQTYKSSYLTTLLNFFAWLNLLLLPIIVTAITKDFEPLIISIFSGLISFCIFKSIRVIVLAAEKYLRQS